MDERSMIRIQINPQNPVQYLACCGIFEILAHFDPYSTSQWIANAKSEFLLDSEIKEEQLTDCLVRSFTDWSFWKSEPMEKEDTSRLDIHLDINGRSVKLSLDWWYEVLDRRGKISKKSAWKMYAGNQNVYGISLGMVDSAKEIVTSASPTSLADLIHLRKGMTGRFGFDPRSSRNALDAGFSANDLNLAVPTFPFAELLASIGAQFFFPNRTGTDGGTRGWMKEEGKDTLMYGLWIIPLPIILARMAASCTAFEEGTNIVSLYSTRASRDKYSNLSMATRTMLRR